MTELEKYIIKNKGLLEPTEIRDNVWLSIENELLEEINKNNHRLIKTLIAGLILVLIGACIIYKTSSENTINEETIIAEYDLKNYNFLHEVDTRINQLVNLSIPENQHENVQNLLRQLEFMDGQYEDYLNYIELNGYQEFIRDQLLEFYNSKIDLLDKIHEEIEKINYYEKVQPTTDQYISIEI